MWYEWECALDLVLVQCLSNFGTYLGSQNCSKIHQKMFLSVPFLEPFFEVLKLFKCLLGAFLSLLCSSWEASGPQKHWKTNCFLRFLQMQLFGSLKFSMALLDPSWLLLGPIWSQNGPENGPPKYLKVVQKFVQKTDPKKLNSKTILGSNLKQFWSQITPKTQQCKLAGTIRPVYGTPKTC